MNILLDRYNTFAFQLRIKCENKVTILQFTYVVWLWNMLYKMNKSTPKL